MAKNQTTQRMINTPQTTLAANPWQSSVIWGNGVVNNGTTVKVPPSISNPASLNPTTTPPKTTGQTPAPVFSDNMTKPAYTTPATTTPAPTVPAKGTVPVPAPAPTTPPLTGVDKVNAETRARVEAERNAQLLPPTATEWAPEGWDMKTGIFDKGNYLGMNITEDEFFTLPFEQQQALIDQAALDVNQKQWMQDQVNLAADLTHQKEYATELNDINTQISGLNSQNAKINSARTVAQAQKDFDTLQQNLGFLGTGGRPVKSTASMNSMARQLVDAQALVNDIKRLEANKQTMMKLGMEFDSKQFEEQIFQINQKMKKEIDASILLAIQGFTSEQMRGYLDTPQKMFEAQNRYLNSVDNSVTGITNRTVQQLKARQDFYAKQAETNMKLLEEDRKTKETMRQEQVQADIEFKKQANTVNEKLSLQTGVLTDWNGNIMRNSDTGAAIKYNPLAGEKPIVENGLLFEPIFNPETGETTYKKTRLYTPASEQGSWSLKELADGTIVKMNDKTGEVSPYNTSEGDPNGNDPASNPTTLNISNPQTLNQIIDFCTTKRGTDSVQCGMLVNDYIMKVTGQNPSGANRFQDSLQSKITAIDNIGRANWPVAGGLFAYPTNDPAGHTGIVTKVNPDGSIEVLEANVKGSAAGWPPKVSTYPASKYKSWTFSQAPAGQKEAEAGVNTAGDAVKNIPWVAPVSKEDQKMQVLGLTQGLWGTEWERAMFANNILKKAQADWITLAEAKKKLGYKSGDDVEFAKARKEQFTNIAKNNEAITKGKSALTLLAAPQTAVNDVAAIVWFLKTIDPSSVARESEVESVESARGMLDNISVKLAKLKDGKKLSTEQRQELRDTIGIIVNAYENNMRDFISSSSQEFNDRGLDMSVYVPKDTIKKYSGGSTTTSGGTTVGGRASSGRIK